MQQKSNKKSYTCETCGEKFYITTEPRFCPMCGGENIYKGTRKSKLTADKCIAELKELIPQMEEVSKHMTELYVKYMTAHETLKTYASRGLISKEDIPTFTVPSMTQAFYDGRKKKERTQQ